MADVKSYYAYDPKPSIAIAFAVVVGLSVIVHAWQNSWVARNERIGVQAADVNSSYYHYWKVMFFMVWGGLCYTAGFVMRAISTNDVGNQNLYVAQYVLIICGPPIFAAAEYNVLGRMLQYLPMHSPLNPRRIMYFFIYLGAIVEGLTASGGARMATAGDDKDRLKSGASIVAAASILQILAESFFMFMVAKTHRRVVRSKMLTSSLRIVFVMLYGTSTLILVRCIYRTIEKFSVMTTIDTARCDGSCSTVLRQEWYFYVFEVAPMALYTLWLNVIHPGRFLPSSLIIYLGYDKLEREAIGWADKRSRWVTFIDPFDWVGLVTKQDNKDAFWERPDAFPLVEKTGKGNARRQVQRLKQENTTVTV